jgi:hypothetical protein
VVALGDDADREQVESPEKLANKAIRENGPIARTGQHVGHFGAKELVVLGGGGVAAIGHSGVAPFGGPGWVVVMTGEPRVRSRDNRGGAAG